MAVGITERGDAWFKRKDWAERQNEDDVDGLVLITKRCTEEFLDYVAENAVIPYIIHATCTGYGGTKVEPNVLPAENILKAVEQADKDKIVLRIDPIFLTEKGVKRAIELAHRGKEIGVKRIRFSFLDLYPHVLRRFANAGYDIVQDNSLADIWFDEIEKIEGISFEACGESASEFPRIQKYISGCISQKDLDIMGIDLQATGKSYQRSTCMCMFKKELLDEKKQCPHGCIYCYWR